MCIATRASGGEALFGQGPATDAPGDGLGHLPHEPAGSVTSLGSLDRAALLPRSYDLVLLGVADHPSLHRGRLVGDPDRAAHPVAAQVDAFAATYPNNRRPRDRILWRG